MPAGSTDNADRDLVLQALQRALAHDLEMTEILGRLRAHEQRLETLCEVLSQLIGLTSQKMLEKNIHKALEELEARNGRRR